jgi:hypothetical protein
MKLNIKRIYIPLYLVEIYLITTILILIFGPVKFNLHSGILFWIYMFLYHIFFIFGYLVGLRINKNINIIIPNFSKNKFNVLLFFGTLGILITYKNLMNSDSLIPVNLFSDLLRGFNEPAEVYVERMSSTVYEGAGPSRLLNISFIFFAFCKLLFIFYFMWFWRFLNKKRKLISVIYSLFYITPGFVAGVNSILFLFIFFTFSSLLVIYYLHFKHKLTRGLLIKLVIVFLIPIYSFGNLMSTRGGSFDYFISSSPIGDISVVTSDVDYTNLSLLETFQYSSVWLDFYLVQGYYGFSLILEEDFKWTYGFGSSAFLQRQLNLLTGIDISNLTYQSRNDNIWGEHSMWHSFYGQFANDFSPLGLIVLMFILGLFLSNVWRSVIIRNSFYGAALLPMFTIMFIFFPANNQVFGYIDSLSYFVFISVFWLFENYKFKLSN